MTPTILHATKGDSETYEFTVKRAGVVVDISGKVLRLMARASSADTGAPLLSLITGAGIVITDGPAGKCRATITPAMMTALAAPVRLAWDLELDEGGTPAVISTVGRGLLYVDADVTR